MIRKVLFAITFFVLLAVSAFWLLDLSKQMRVYEKPWKAIPKDAAMIFHFENPAKAWYELSTNSILWQSLSGTERIDTLKNQLLELEGIFSKKPAWEDRLQAAGLVLSAHKSPKGELDILLAVGLDQNINSDSLKNFVKQGMKGTIETTRYAEIPIHTCKNYHFAAVEKAVVASKNFDLVKRAIDQNGAEKGLPQDSLFLELTRTFSAQSNANLLINFNESAGWSLSHITVPETTANWLAFDLDVNGASVFANGIILATEQSESEFGLLKGQSRGTSSLIPMLPADFGEANSYQFNNRDLLIEKLKSDLLKRSEILNSQLNEMAQIAENCDCDLRESALGWVSDEICRATLPDGEHQILLFGLTDKIEAAEMLAPLVKDKIKFRDFEILSLSYPKAYRTLLGNRLEREINYVLLLENHAVLSGDLSDLQEYCIDILSQNTFKDHPLYASYETHTNPKSSFTYILRPSASAQTTLYKTRGDLNALLLARPQLMSKTSLMVAQIHHLEDDKFIQYTWMQSQRKEEENTQSIAESSGWQIILPEKLQGEPTLLRNHYTNTKEVFVQDENNHVHLISPIGEELWSKPIGSKIEGNPVQIDVYKNGKLQILFNTAEKIYCLDRNGNPVEGFPVVTDDAIVSSVQLFDYDKRRNYRILATLADGSVTNYGVSGKKVEGWQSDKKLNIATPLQYSRIKMKDYLVGLSADGKIHILDRTGKSRYTSKAKAVGYNGEQFYLETSQSIGQSKLHYVTNDGQWMRLPLNGDAAETNAEGVFEITFAHLDADSKKDAILSKDSLLIGSELRGEEIWRYATSKQKVQALKVFNFGDDDKRAGWFDSKSDSIYLLRPSGALNKGFPRAARSIFAISDLDLNNKMELVRIDSLGGLLVEPFE